MVVHNQAGVVSFLGSLGIDTLVVTRYHHHVLDHKSQHEHHVTSKVSYNLVISFVNHLMM